MNAAGPARKIRVLTVDDHPVMRDGISSLLSAEIDIQVVGEASNGEEGVSVFKRTLPDVTLMDLQMQGGNGVDAIAAIRREFGSARIIVLTMLAGDALAVRALRVGAAGYLLKSSLRNELVMAIRTVHAGRRFIHPDVAETIAMHAGDPGLSERELSVLASVAEGKLNKEIAWCLGLSEDTVKSHLKSIFGKLDAKDRTQAVTIAHRRGIISLDGI